jgi:hypothetical protein
MPATPRRLAALFRTIDGLTPLLPGGAAAEQAGAECQRRLLACLEPGGPRAAARLIGALERRYPQSQAQPQRRLWMWRLVSEDPRRALDVTVHSRGIYFSYGILEEPSPRQKRRYELRDRFYARHLEVGQRAYAPGPAVRLSRHDRLILLVGELEADVNNGGFDQYLLNKGRRRARAALSARRAIGARRTAGLLEAALDPAATSRDLDALDGRFYAGPDDLAVLAMRYVGRGGPPRGRDAGAPVGG